MKVLDVWRLVDDAPLPEQQLNNQTEFGLETWQCERAGDGTNTGKKKISSIRGRMPGKRRLESPTLGQPAQH